jgi:hypothetical protein
VSADDEHDGRRAPVIQFSQEEIAELLGAVAEAEGRPMPKAIPAAATTIPTRHRTVSLDEGLARLPGSPHGRDSF